METTDSDEPPIPEKPVAYDADGQPLYSHPGSSHEPGETKSHDEEREAPEPNDPENINNDEILKLKSLRSKQAFPELNLSEDEYVISYFMRHPIGLLIPFLLGIILIVALLLAIINNQQIVTMLEINIYSVNPASVVLPLILFMILVVIVLYVMYRVYYNNNFYLTNVSVIQTIQTAPFSRREQTVTLANIEESSYVQNSIMQQLFNYGSIRLSTLGAEDTYRLSYVMNPKQQIDKLNDAVRAASRDRVINV